MPRPAVNDPAEVYVHLHTDAEVHLEPLTDDFWPSISERTDLHTGRLVTGIGTAGDWTVWEMHPEGDELIIVTEGSCRFHLDDGSEVTEHVVTAPQFVLVPKGVWHTMDEIDAGRAVVVTWGAGTQHRPR
jgi:quercetin dioxygenase-like cupin family protein